MGVKVKKTFTILLTTILVLVVSVPVVFSFWGSKTKSLIPQNGAVKIPIADITDGKAHYFKIKANDGIMVSFFVLKSSDGVIRAAIDACDVCYRSGKGYVQEGDFMVCTNCGRKFASTRTLDDAIYKLENSTPWPNEIISGILEIEGVEKAMTDKGGTRLVITFDRTEVDTIMIKDGSCLLS